MSSLQNPKPEDKNAKHWSLSSKIEASKYLTLFTRLPNKLTASNFISWMFAVEATLDTIDLLGYINGSIATHFPQHMRYENWQAANALIHSILITNMSEEAAVQMSHLWNAREIWQEAKHLFSGQTMTDYTLTNTLIHRTWPPISLRLHILNSAGSSMAALPPTSAKTNRHSLTLCHITTLLEASTRKLQA